MRRSTWATPAPMAHCSAPLGDRDHAPTRVKFAKRACGWLAAALPPAPEHVVTPVERTSVKEPSTESLGVTHDVTPGFRGRGQCITPKLNRKMLFFMPQISIFRLRRSDRRLQHRKCFFVSCSGKSTQDPTFFCTFNLAGEADCGAKKVARVPILEAKKMTSVPILDAKKMTAKKTVLRVQEQLRKGGECS